MKTIAATVLLIALAIVARAQPRYRITDLGTLPGGNTASASGINDRGQVVGWAEVPAGPHAYLYSNGQMQDLGTLGQGVYGDRFSIAWAINNHGQVVGDTTTRNDDIFFIDAFLWTAGQFTDLGSLGGDEGGAALGINDRSIVVGFADEARSNTPHAFLYDGVLHDLGFGDASFATGINNLNQVTVAVELINGTSLTGNYHSFIWQDGQSQSLPTLGGSYTYASAINNRSFVVGDSTLSGDTGSHAFLYAFGKIYDLDPHSSATSRALAINQRGQVVGSSYANPQGSNPRAFSWQPGDKSIRDLNTMIDPSAGWILNNATGINDRGQIVGDGLHNGLQRAFLLTPLWGFEKPDPLR